MDLGRIAAIDPETATAVGSAMPLKITHPFPALDPCDFCLVLGLWRSSAQCHRRGPSSKNLAASCVLQ